jgi:hypothetical protein
MKTSQVIVLFRISQIRFLASGLLLSACVVRHPDYPPTWAALQSTGHECPLLTGLFENRGESHDPTVGNPVGKYLSYYLFPNLKDFKSVNKIGFSQSEPDMLEVSAWMDENLLVRKQFSKTTNEYNCQNGMILLSRSEGVNREGVVAISSETVYLAKSADDGLILNYASSGFGIVLLIPVGASEINWFRFKPFTSKRN